MRRAAEIFERDGYEAASIESIADAVGVKREAIYYYFKNKAHILNAVIRPASESMLKGIDVILGLDVSSQKKLLLALQNHIDRFNPNFLEMSVIARDQRLLDKLPECRELAKIWSRYTHRWIALVTEGQENGQFVATLNTKVVAYTILGMCNWLSRWYDPAKSITPTEIVHIYFRLIGGGLIVNFANHYQFGLATEPAGRAPSIKTLSSVKSAQNSNVVARTEATSADNEIMRSALQGKQVAGPGLGRTIASKKCGARRGGAQLRSP